MQEIFRGLTLMHEAMNGDQTHLWSKMTKNIRDNPAAAESVCSLPQYTTNTSETNRKTDDRKDLANYEDLNRKVHRQEFNRFMRERWNEAYNLCMPRVKSEIESRGGTVSLNGWTGGGFNNKRGGRGVYQYGSQNQLSADAE